MQRLLNRFYLTENRYDLFFYFVMLVAVLVRFNRFGDDLGVDEGFNWFVSKDGVEAAITRIHQDFFPPLYNVLLAGWLNLVPDSALMVRAPSMVAGLLTVYVAYLLVMKGMGQNAARIALVLVALSPSNVYWSQFARQFSVSSFFALVALYFGYSIVKETRAKVEAGDPQGGAPVKYYVGLGVFLLAGVYTNNIALVFTFASFFVFAYITFMQTRLFSWGKMKPLIATYAGAFLLWLPWAPSFLTQRQHSLESSILAHHAPAIDQIQGDLINFVSVDHLWSFQWLQHIVTWPLFFAGVWFLVRRREDWSRLLIGFSLLYPAILAGLFFADPIFGRVLQRSIWLSSVWSLLVAHGAIWFMQLLAEKFRKKTIVRTFFISGCGALLIGVFSLSLINTYRVTSDGWSRFSARIAPRISAEDIILPFHAVEYGTLLYYLGPKISDAGQILPQALLLPSEDDVIGPLKKLRDKYTGTRVKNIWFVGDREYIINLEHAVDDALVDEVLILDGAPTAIRSKLNH